MARVRVIRLLAGCVALALALEASASAVYWMMDGDASAPAAAPRPSGAQPGDGLAELSEDETRWADFGETLGSAHAFYLELQNARRRAAVRSCAAYSYSGVARTVPEPTGGLLVLAGLVALGLKRGRGLGLPGRAGRKGART